MIKLEDVCKTYPDGTEAVKNLNLDVNEGEFCVFLGPSGCGKTTSLKMINRLIPLSSGKIYINDKEITQVNVNELRRDIGYAIQNIGLFPHLSVAQNIATVPMLKKWSKDKQRKRAEELLDLIGMDPSVYMDRFPAELSGGQQQRVGVARCLGADPPVLLMDEPFGAIDPITRTRLQDEFLKIQAKLKKTIVFVTHDINEAIKMGDTIALMRKGELVQYADAATLLDEPKNEFVRDFVGADRVLKSLRLHRTRDVMQDAPVLAREGDRPEKVLDEMNKAKINWAIMVDANDRLLGWLVKKDMKTAKDLMDVLEETAVSADPATPLNDALSMMLHSAIGNLAVTDDHDKFLGVITFPIIRDLLAGQTEEDDDEEENEPAAKGGEEE
jgi:osmoprotectant transport system ATP-binding protein